MKFWLLLLVGIVLFILGGVSGYLFSQSRQGKPFLPGSKEVRLGGYRFINPLLECQNAEELGTTLDSLKKSVNDVVSAHVKSGDATIASVYFQDLNNGPWFGINLKAPFSPASLLKLPLLMSYLQQNESDPTFLQKKVTFKTDQDYDKDQTIINGPDLAQGKQYTIEQLLENMIEYSDNNAAYFLFNYLNKDQINQVYRDLDMPVLNGSVDTYTLTVRDYALFIRVLYNASYISRASSEQALEFLSKVTYMDGLVAGVPKNVIVAHKFGERVFGDNNEKRELHDCGIIYYPAHPYLLCVMTQGSDSTKLTKTIADISTHVYSEVKKLVE
ncbi:MAG TPA: serine hydrolase [Patescibacteria group bacterium]|nr:serine hydrolase [Patescibacteria group bacterium]